MLGGGFCSFAFDRAEEVGREMFGVWHWERDDLKKRHERETLKKQLFCETLWDQKRRSFLRAGDKM